MTDMKTGIFCFGAAAIALASSTVATGADLPNAAADLAAYDQAAAGEWRKVFSDPCTRDWKEKWFLDGEVGTVKNTPQGMELTAGPEFKNDAHHLNLWTKESFAGDLKIEYEYTRLDREDRCVTILYIQATGSGEGLYDKDITKWNEPRRIPSMATYFNHLNTYQISYAAFPDHHIRARRYLPEKTGLNGTELQPDYFPEGLVGTGVLHRISIIKKGRDLFMRIDNGKQTVHCHMINPDLPEITEGRIGLRHMFTRSACYGNFQISTPALVAAQPGA